MKNLWTYLGVVLWALCFGTIASFQLGCGDAAVDPRDNDDDDSSEDDDDDSSDDDDDDDDDNDDDDDDNDDDNDDNDDDDNNDDDNNNDDNDDNDDDNGGDIKSFTITLVRDNLSPLDGEEMRDGLTELGYENLGWYRDVTTAELKANYLNPAIGIQWHTGHGTNGTVVTSNGRVSVSSFSDGEIAAQYVTTATCLTLSDSGWRDKMGPSSKGVMGYTQVTMDGTADRTVGRMFRENLGGGHTMAWTWYKANTQYESDRWRIFYRENGTITDYKPGNIPDNKCLAKGEQTALTDRIIVANALLGNSRDYHAMFGHLANVSYRLEQQASPDTRVFRVGLEFLAKTSMTQARATEIADAYLKNRLPSDAVLEYILPITAAHRDGAERVVAYQVRYKRMVDGLAVNSNFMRQHYQLLINDDRVASSSILWPALTRVKSGQPDILNQILTVDMAVAMAADDIERLVKKPVTIVDVEPSYANTMTTLIPAYTFKTANGGQIVVSARTGDVIQ